MQKYIRTLYLSEEQINDILEEVRRLRSKGKKKKRNDNNNDSQYADTDIEEHEQEIVATSN